MPQLWIRPTWLTVKFCTKYPIQLYIAYTRYNLLWNVFYVQYICKIIFAIMLTPEELTTIIMQIYSAGEVPRSFTLQIDVIRRRSHWTLRLAQLRDTDTSEFGQLGAELYRKLRHQCWTVLNPKCLETLHSAIVAYSVPYQTVDRTTQYTGRSCAVHTDNTHRLESHSLTSNEQTCSNSLYPQPHP